MTDVATHGRFEAGRVLKGALALLKRAPLKLVLWAIVFAGLPDAAINYANIRFSTAETTFTSWNGWLLLIATILTSMLGMVALQAVVTHNVTADDEGARHRFGGLSDYVALAMLGLVTSLGIVGGFILLVIPGVILSMAWLVVVPAMVTERLGVMESIQRSNTLTGDAKGHIFGLSLAIGLAGGLASWLVGLITGALDIAFVTLIAPPALQALTGLFSAVFAVAVYQELRLNKEGTPTDRLVEVFA
jgi:hypothetical protein